MNEAETRAKHVDPALAAAGWGVVEGSRRVARKLAQVVRVAIATRGSGLAGSTQYGALRRLPELTPLAAAPPRQQSCPGHPPSNSGELPLSRWGPPTILSVRDLDKRVVLDTRKGAQQIFL
jgi:hypothetical protein